MTVSLLRRLAILATAALGALVVAGPAHAATQLSTPGTIT